VQGTARADDRDHVRYHHHDHDPRQNPDDSNDPDYDADDTHADDTDKTDHSDGHDAVQQWGRHSGTRRRKCARRRRIRRRRGAGRREMSALATTREDRGDRGDRGDLRAREANRSRDCAGAGERT
jgi:hypothetical protein